MAVRSTEGHASRFEISPRPEDKTQSISSCHQRKHSESSASSSESTGGPATPSSTTAFSPRLATNWTLNYSIGVSRDEGTSWAYGFDSMDADSGYGYYGTPQGESSGDAAAGLQPTDGYCCLIPGCKAVPFKRNADLDRHYKHKHRPDERKESYYCDYPKCSRRDSPFHRRDHFRDHLREYHKEDIAKRGRSAQIKFDGPQSKRAWWRCTKCLKRVMVEESGYECPGCNTSCDTGKG